MTNADAGSRNRTHADRKGSGSAARRASAAESTRHAKRAVNRAAWKTAPILLTAALAFVGAAEVIRLPPIAAPIRLALIVLVLAAGNGLMAVLDRRASRPYWQIALFSILILLPIVALQASASRVPFVALTRGSAVPLLWLTLAAILTLVGLWLFVAFQSVDAPEDGALLFLPSALLVQAVLGAPGSIDESAALLMAGEAFLVGAVVIFLALLCPPRWKPIAGAVAIGGQFVILWALGRGPVIGRESGFVVPASAFLLMLAVVVLTMLAPLAALFGRRFVQTVAQQPGGQTTASPPARGARRSSEF